MVARETSFRDENIMNQGLHMVYVKSGPCKVINISNCLLLPIQSVIYTMAKYGGHKTATPGPLSVLVWIFVFVCFPLRTTEWPNSVKPGFVDLANLNQVSDTSILAMLIESHHQPRVQSGTRCWIIRVSVPERALG